MHVCKCICVLWGVYTCMYMHLCKCMCACLYVSVCVYMYVSVYGGVHVCKYIYIIHVYMCIM